MKTAQVLQPTVSKISGGALEIAAAKSFSYPTRLADAWTPKILEIHHPPYLVWQDDIAIQVAESTTCPPETPTKNPLKKATALYRNLKEPLECEDEYLFDCRFETDRNIAHILVLMVTPILAARQFFPNLKAVTYSKPSKMISTIFDLLGIPMICSDRKLSGKIISVSGRGNGIYELLQRSLFDSFYFPQANQQTPDRVFISRKGDRSLINESEIEALLQEYGFQKFYYEDIPIEQQWTITKNAKCIVGLHGAALSSLLFNRNAVKLIELFHPGYVVDMYRNMVNAVGGSWCGVTGQITPDVVEGLDFEQDARRFALTPTKIDPRSLKMALEAMQIYP